MVSMLVNAVKPMLGTRTKAKIMSSSNQDPLNELVWESQRSELYGGTSKKEIKWLDVISLVKKPTCARRHTRTIFELLIRGKIPNKILMVVHLKFSF